MPTAAESTDPAISVVIPTHDREVRLAFTLEALAAQTLPSSRFEVIVVRSQATPPPYALAPEGLEVRFVAAAPSRPGQRNVGWREARGQVVAFTDDDCRPAPGWLESLLERADPENVIVQGRTEPDPDEVHLLHGLARSQTVNAAGPWYQTCNIAFSRSLLDRIGGFDEAFVALGEDTDLALRAIDAGADVRFAPNALVWHAVLPQPIWTAARGGWNRWWTTPLLFKRHPGHRRHLFAGVFFNRSHAGLALFAVAAVLARRRPVLVALALIPYAIEDLDTENTGPRGLLRQAVHLPARLVADAALAAGLARGAVRFRSPVL